jgi:3-oxoacyl-[acyl-carrier-protein] synthase II
VISGTTGLAVVTEGERAFLEAHPELPSRATGTHIGHGLEPQFVMNVGLAALAAQRGRLFPSHHRFEREMTGALTQVLVTSVAHWRGVGMGLVESIP